MRALGESESFPFPFLFIFGGFDIVWFLVAISESLSLSSAVGVLLAVVFVGICFVMAVSALLEGKTKSPRLLPKLDNQASFLNLFTAVPVIVTAFTFHFNGKKFLALEMVY